MIITTSRSPNCLVAYLATCIEPLKSRLSIETGHSDRLIISDEDWEIIPEWQRDIITAHADGFTQGWSAKEDWED